MDWSRIKILMEKGDGVEAGIGEMVLRKNKKVDVTKIIRHSYGIEMQQCRLNPSLAEAII
jgi:hypothetical protein